MEVEVIWISRQKNSVTLSSTEAEYIALPEVATEILFIRNLLYFMGLETTHSMIVNMNNTGSIFMVKITTPSTRTKHVDAWFTM